MKSHILIQAAIKLFKCDEARIVEFEHTSEKFLILGWYKTSENEWFNQDNEPQTFEYLEEKTVARGKTLDELWQDALYYHKVMDMSIKDFF